MSYDNDNKGVLFRAQEKKTDKHPDYDGNITIDGVEYWLSGWMRTSAKGTKFLSLSVKPKAKPEIAPKRQEPARASKGSGFDDMIVKAKEGLAQMRQQRGEAYRTGMAAVSGDNSDILF
jgi:hypothetical protein